jgi:hypothetical protein
MSGIYDLSSLPQKADYAELAEVVPLKGSSLQIPLAGQDPHRFLLLLRFVLFNLAAFAMLGLAWAQGWIDQLVSADKTGLSIAICIVFAIGLALCAVKVWRVSVELNVLRQLPAEDDSWASSYLQAIRGRNAGSRSIMASTFRSKVFVRIAVVRNIANSLVLLGLIGTVVGFIIALSGVDPATVGDVTSVSPMVSRLLNGMSVALYTTLVGGVLNLWLSVNYQLLAAGAATMLTTAISLGEVHARD